MANRADWQMLNDSLGNLGNSFVINRQMQAQQEDRTADRAMRERLMDEQVAQRREAAEANATARNQPRISAFIADPDHPEQGVSAEGSWESIQQIIAETAKGKGKSPLVLPKPPGAVRGIDQTFTIGGVKITTHDPEHTKIIEEKLKAAGIDPYAVKPTPGLTPVNTPGFKGALTPGGAYVKPDAEQLNEPEKIKLQSLYRQMQSIEKETRDMAASPNPARARALNEQRKRLEEDIAKFTKPAGKATDGGTVEATAGMTPKAAAKKPTRAQAAEYVTKFGQAQAKAKLTADGFDVSGYAD